MLDTSVEQNNCVFIVTTTRRTLYVQDNAYFNVDFVFSEEKRAWDFIELRCNIALKTILNDLKMAYTINSFKIDRHGVRIEYENFFEDVYKTIEFRIEERKIL